MAAKNDLIKFTNFKELEGKLAYVSEWMPIDREHLKMFASATYMDSQHSDLSISQNNEFGPDLVDGFLILSLLTYWNAKYLPVDKTGLWGLNYGLDTVRFLEPVMVGDPIRARCDVGKIDPWKDGWRGELKLTVEKEGAAKPAMVAEWVVLFLKNQNG